MNEQITQERLNTQLRRYLGDTVLTALEDDSVVEIMLNPDGRLWLDKHGAGMVHVGQMTAIQAENLVCSVAAMLGEVANKETPVVEGELPLDGSRFEGVLPPVTEAPSFSIRKRASVVYPLESYVDKGILSRERYDRIVKGIIQRENILVVGSTGSGKTTFGNAILQKIADVDPGTRVAIIEDTRELQCPIENKVALRTSPTVTMNHLLRACMRMRPDRIVVGETRGPEALTLLKSWNTGHPGGLATVHANSAPAGLVRLEQLIMEANVPPLKALIAEAVNLIVFIARTNTGREVEEVVEVLGVDEAGYVFQSL